MSRVTVPTKRKQYTAGPDLDGACGGRDTSSATVFSVSQSGKSKRPALMESVAAKLFTTTDLHHHLGIDIGRGHIVRRKIWVTNARAPTSPTPRRSSGSAETCSTLEVNGSLKMIVHGITSLAPSPRRRSPVGYANTGHRDKIHWVRDVVFA